MLRHPGIECSCLAFVVKMFQDGLMSSGAKVEDGKSMKIDPSSFMLEWKSHDLR
jgi:hypothetical protein